MSVLICGSFAYDTIMVFHDKFKHHILADKVHMLNVSFLVSTMRREFGGCAGNIAYNLGLLCDEGLPMGTVGNDFSPYARWMDECGISRQYVTTIDSTYTGQAFIVTDEDDNQITAFHPGAMNESHVNQVPVNAGIRLGIVSPDGREGMIAHARQFFDAGIAFVFDPGQGLPMFDGVELKEFIRQATWVIVNDYEGELMRQRTGLSAQEIAEKLQAYIVTKGGEGSTIYADGRQYHIPNIKVSEIKDPTGCGDAYRGGLLYGLLRHLDWESCGRIGALLGGLKVEHEGTQNHRPSREELAERYKMAFGEDIAL